MWQAYKLNILARDGSEEHGCNGQPIGLQVFSFTGIVLLILK
jgi:hypothetical protein